MQSQLEPVNLHFCAFLPRKSKTLSLPSGLEDLYPVDSATVANANRLRSLLFDRVEECLTLVSYLRNTIPDAANSDARNTLQLLSDRLIDHLYKATDDLTVVVSKELSLYQHHRVDKKDPRFTQNKRRRIA